MAGLTLTRFNNTALVRTAGTSSPAVVVQSVEAIPDCDAAAGISCAGPSSFLLSGRIAPPAAGRYGFNVSFDPPLPFPSQEAYARLWVDSHLLHPRSTAQATIAGGVAPLWIPLPARPLDGAGNFIEAAGATPPGSYDVRLEYVCMAPGGCGGRTVTLRWSNYTSLVPFPSAAPLPAVPATPIPVEYLLPTQSAAEVWRRSVIYDGLVASGWGTFYRPSWLAWELLPEGFLVQLALVRASTGEFLPPNGLTLVK